MARYWRMTSILTWSGTLELSEAQLYEAGSPVAVTPTASVAPTSGNLSDLVDGLATANVVWSGAIPTLMWDTAGLTAPFPRLGSGTIDETFPVDFIFQGSDDGANWVTDTAVASLAYPGAQALTSGSYTTAPRKYKASALARAVYTNPDVGIPTTISVTQHRREFNFLDAYYGGQYQITGTVKEKSTPTNKPLKRRVVLIDERSRLTVAEAWSDATGNYRFYGIRGDLAYTVISYDYSGTYRAVIADNVTPEQIV